MFERTGERAHLEAARSVLDGVLEEYRNAGAEFYIKKAERLREDVLSR
jgi:hypothetical protein